MTHGAASARYATSVESTSEIFVLDQRAATRRRERLRTTMAQHLFSVVLPRLAAELHETALSESAARWAVQAWAEWSR